METYLLSLEKATIHSNIVITDNFISSLGKADGNTSKNLLWRNISAESICNYLSNFKVSSNLKVDLEGIVRFINKLNQVGELTSWSIALMNKKTLLPA